MNVFTFVLWPRLLAMGAIMFVLWILGALHWAIAVILFIVFAMVI